MFGTDGIRSKANQFPMQADMVLKISQAAALAFKKKGLTPGTGRVVVCKDTRRSGYMFENAVTSGLISMGLDVFLLGPMPTPALAFLVESMRADFGVMITASHNNYSDNGLKIFDRNGFKISKDLESEIESIIEQDEINNHLALGRKIGKAFRLRGTEGRYLQHIKSFFPKEIDLSSLKIVVDCANGASYKVAPEVLYELNAKEVIPLSVEPNGLNINDKCGSTCPDNVVNSVKEHKADVGIAFDGDADRLIMVDEKASVVDGDVLIGILAKYWHKTGKLKGNTVVGTCVSNGGLETFLHSLGIKFVRTDVGDKNIISYLKQHNLNLGGEVSGHLILLDRNTCSDGISGCLEILSIMVKEGRTLSELAAEIPVQPQVCTNIEGGKAALEVKEVQDFISKTEEECAETVKILVRKSGTENKIRVFTDGPNEAHNTLVNEKLVNFIKKFIRGIDK